MTTVTIPDSVTYIGTRSFSNCQSLESFYGKYASEDNRCLVVDCVLNSFAPAGVTEYAIPDGVTSIGQSAFWWSGATTGKESILKSVTIPESVTSIGESAFYGCTSLTAVYCKPITPPAVSSSAFSNKVSDRKIYVLATSAVDYMITWGISSIVGYDFEKGEETAIVPANNEIWHTSTNEVVVTPYATDVFCANIIHSIYINGQGIIVFDGDVTQIGDSAFEWCRDLTSITIPNSVISIGNRAFRDCNNLSAFYGKFASQDNRCLIVDGILKAYAPAGLTEYSITNNVTSIGDYVFWDCTSLTNITIPNSVTSIGKWALANTSLTNFTIPDGVISLGEHSFNGCEKLTNIVIPDSVTSIESSAFSHCSNLTSVYCKSITPPICKATTYLGWNAFDYNATGRKIYVPTDSVEAYKAANGWSGYADYIVGYDFD